MSKPHYYRCPVVSTLSSSMKYIAIVEELDGKQTTIASCVYSRHTYNGYELAFKDANLIVDALNFYMENKNANSPTPD